MVEWRSRLFHTALVIFGVVLATFVVANVMPGNVAVTILGEGATPSAIAQLERELGLDRPLFVRFGEYVANLARGDFGTTAQTREDILPMVLRALAVSAELMILSQIIAVAAAVSLAQLSRRYRGAVSKITGAIASLTLAVPGFLLGVLMVYAFAIELKWFPAVGFVSLGVDPLGNLRSMILPAVALAAAEIGIYYRMLDSEMGEIERLQYVEAARSKGLSQWRVLNRHVLRNALFPLVTVVGLNVGRLLGGAVVIETLFGLPGLGHLLVEAVGKRDLFLMQGVVLFIAIAYVLVNFFVDLLYTTLDPRLRTGRST